MSTVCNKKTVNRIFHNPYHHAEASYLCRRATIHGSSCRNQEHSTLQGSPGCWEVTRIRWQDSGFPLLCDREEAFDQINASMTTCPIDGRQIPVGGEHVPQLVKYLKFQHQRLLMNLRRKPKDILRHSMSILMVIS